MVRRIIVFLIIMLGLVGCTQKSEPMSEDISEYLNENIDMSNVKDFDLDEAISQIESELDKVYVPKISNMYSATREFNYSVQGEFPSIDSKYELDAQYNRSFPAEVKASYTRADGLTMPNGFQDQLVRLFKRATGNSERINQNGFKGYYESYGAKLENTRFEVYKDGYSYSFQPPVLNPSDEDYDFISDTINSLDKAREFGEWEEIKSSFIQRIELPDAADYRSVRISFILNYDYYQSKEMKYTFDNNDTRYTFAAYEPDKAFNIHDLYFKANTEKTFTEKDSFYLFDKIDIKRTMISNRDRVKIIVYEWELDDLKYYLSVKDDRLDDPDFIEDYEEEYLEIIASSFDDYDGEPVEVTNEAAEKEELSDEDVAKAYDEVIDLYERAINEDWDKKQLDTEANFRMGTGSEELRSVPLDYGYIRYDLNGNGQEELLFGRVIDDKISDIDEVFILADDGEVVKVFEGGVFITVEFNDEGVMRVEDLVSESSSSSIHNTTFYDLTKRIDNKVDQSNESNLTKTKDVTDDNFSPIDLSNEPAHELYDFNFSD